MMRQKEVAVLVLLFVLLAAGNTFAQEEALSSVGALGAGYLYTSYLSVGAIADGHYYEVYDDETTVQLMEEIKSLADATRDSLQELLHSDILNVENFTFINEIINTLGLLYSQAESYQNYVETGDEKQATLYDNYRNNAWAKIVDLLGIEE